MIVYYTHYLFATKCLNPTQKSDKYENNLGRLFSPMYVRNKPAGDLITCEPNHYENSPTADDAFPPRLTSLSKQRESIIRYRDSYHMAIINTKAARKLMVLFRSF